MNNLVDFESYSAINESYLPPITDHEILAATLVGEAGGETDPKKGMTAVLNVLKNRSKQKETSKAGEALRPYRFSMWNDVTKNISNKSDYHIPSIKNIVNKWKKHPQWKNAIELIKSDPKDITGGANSYYAYRGNNKVASAPDWVSKWKKTADIGNHRFGYLKEL